MVGSLTPTSWRRVRAGFASGPEEVERRGDAELAAGGTSVAQRGVEPGREAEADAGLVDAPRDAVAVELERHTQRLEQIGRSARRRRRAVAVLAHRNTRPGDDERGQRRHVDRVTAIPAGADDVDEPVDAHRRARRLSAATSSIASSRPSSSSTVSPFIRRAT